MNWKLKRMIREPIRSPADLSAFNGWEIRRTNILGRKAVVIIQNPDSGETRRLCFRPAVFDRKSLFVIKGKV